MQSPRHTIARLGLVTSTAALAYFGSVAGTLCPRWCVAVEARTSVGYTLGFVLAYAPSRVAPRHVACDAVARGMLDIARYNQVQLGQHLRIQIDRHTGVYTRNGVSLWLSCRRM